MTATEFPTDPGLSPNFDIAFGITMAFGCSR